VGNFLGVSLSHFVKYVCQRNEKSVVVSIDPNIQHQGVESPQNHVISILNHFGLQKNAIICVGYSINKTLSNDGIAFVGENGTEYDPYSRFRSEQSCEDTLSNLCASSEERFDFAVVDGNQGDHLRRETAILRRLIRPGGILILDDVSDSWSEIKAEYETLRSTGGWRAVAADGRVGLLQRGS
jgi:Methyltransferase domain